MTRRSIAVLLTLLIGLAAPGWAEDAKKPTVPAEKEKPKESDDEKPIVTHHELKLGEKTLKYQATAGLMPLRDGEGKTEARIFYIAYTREEDANPAQRPLMFSFNGGPGSSSVWLHLGALGPKRVPLPDDATIPAPPFRLVDNAESWLDKTDLVFIDPVGTGYSRAVKPELNKKYHGLRGDISSVGEFIRMYLGRNERWTSPLFIVGESYGTTRAAGLAGHLAGEGIALNGVILISTVLDFQTISYGRTNEASHVLFLPAYTATAWYHKKLPPDLQQAGLRRVLDEAVVWAEGDYRAALEKGDRLSADERAAIVKKLARYTGLSEHFVDLHDLRVSQGAFRKELLRDQRRTVGRFDSRYLGLVEDTGRPSPEFDASEAAIRPSYTSTFNQYVRAALGYRTDVPYNILGGIGAWDWGTSGSGYPETSSALSEAMAKNPHMKVLIAAGYYDLATPFAAVDYTLSHMKLDPSLRRNIRVTTYEAGHMMYLFSPSLAALKQDAARFIDGAVGQ